MANGSPQFAAPEVDAQADSQPADAALQTLVEHKQSWAEAPLSERIALLQRTQEALRGAATEWVRLCCQAKGLATTDPRAGEEWLAGPCVVARNLRLLIESLQDIERYGCPKLPGRPYRNAAGRTVAPVFPSNLMDRLLFSGCTAEIWMQAEVGLEELPETMATCYRERARGEVCLVLGAGNVSSIGPMDALYKLFVQRQVVLLKLNPVNDYLEDIYRRALAPLFSAGVLACVRGGASVGQYLCEHPSVDAIHITGSDKTHDAIVFGMGDEALQRRRDRRPANEKTITSELGNVSPILVVPGNWTATQLQYQAENVATMLANNGGFNCVSARVLVTHDEWPQRDDFLRALKLAFSRIPTRMAYYPGAADRHAQFLEGRPPSDVQVCGEPTESKHLPWTLVRVDPNAVEDACFRQEAFCSLMAETSLSAASPEAFLQAAVTFANERLWGSLSANLLISPASLRDPEMANACEQALAALRYGTVSVNHWAALSYGLVTTPWGAYPGHPAWDIQSGSGFVHNTYMFAAPEKTVLRGPFRAMPKPVWFATHRSGHQVGPALFEFESRPSWFTLPRVALAAAWG